MNAAQLEAWLAANKAAVIAVGAAGAVGLGLYKRKKSGDVGADPAGKAAAAAAAPSYSAGGQVAAATGGAAYDSTSSDLFAALSPQLNAIGTQLSQINSAAPPTPVPAPIASGLYAPTKTGNYVRYTDGTVAEVESDGSQYGMTWNEWAPLVGSGATYSQLNVTPDTNGYVNTLQRNLTAKTPTPANP